jgi:hypothetical protein
MWDVAAPRPHRAFRRGLVPLMPPEEVLLVRRRVGGRERGDARPLRVADPRPELLHDVARERLLQREEVAGRPDELVAPQVRPRPDIRQVRPNDQRIVALEQPSRQDRANAERASRRLRIRLAAVAEHRGAATDAHAGEL